MNGGTPSGSFGVADLKTVLISAAWTLGAAVIGAGLTALADTLITTVLPNLKEIGVIDATLFVLCTTLVDAFRKAIRQWIIDSRVVKLILLAIGLSLVGSSSYAQEIKLPMEVKVAKAGSWFMLAPEVISGGLPRWRIDPALEEQRLDLLFVIPEGSGIIQKGKVFAASEDGKYKIEVWNAKDNVPSDIYVCWVTVGKGIPDPIPPPPVPPPGPNPPPVPSVAGSRVVLFIHETRLASHTLNSQLNLLRRGPSAEFLTSKKHDLRILDVEEDDGSGGDAVTLKNFKPYWEGKTLPVLVIYDPSTKKVLLSESVSNTITADGVVILVDNYDG